MRKGFLNKENDCVERLAPSHQWLQPHTEAHLGPTSQAWDVKSGLLNGCQDEYTLGTENQAYYNKPLYTPEQTRGAINLSSVKFQYHPQIPCGPSIASCQDIQGLLQGLGQISAASMGDPETQLSFMKPKGNMAGQPTQCPQDFSGFIFCGRPNENPKILLINKNEAFEWMRHLLYSKDQNGKEVFSPDRPLSVEGLLEKGEVSVIQNCHYLAIHRPAATKKQGKGVVHDQRVWIEPLQAKTQVFSCSGNLISQNGKS